MLFWTPGPTELIIIFLIVLLLFGGKKLPSLARSIGSGINEFKKGLGGQGKGEPEAGEDEESIAQDSTPPKTSKRKKKA